MITRSDPSPHVLAADGLFTPDGRFHWMPAEDLAPAIELFRHRFLHALRDSKQISPSRDADLLFSPVDPLWTKYAEHRLASLLPNWLPEAVIIPIPRKEPAT